MVRAVHCTGGVVEKERPMRIRRALHLHPRNGLVGDVLGHVVVGLIEVWHDGRVVAVHRRLVLTGLSRQDSIEAVEAQATRPAIEWSGRGLLPSGREMPLTKRCGREAIHVENLSDGSGLFGNNRVVAGKNVGTLGDTPHVHCVMVAARHQRCSRGRAQGGGVELVVFQATPSHTVECGGRDRTTKCGARAKANVVEQDHDHVWRTSRRRDNLHRRSL